MVGCANPGKSTADLRSNIGWHVVPGQPALSRVGQRDSWVEVRSRNRPERENQRYEGSASGDRVRKECDRHVPSSWSLADRPFSPSCLVAGSA